ncbi:hypothetical protein AAG906_029348 [Vitis piasezkii]
MLQNHFARENGVCEISQTLKKGCEITSQQKVFSQGCEVGFQLEVLSFQLVAYIGQLQEEIHHTVQKGCEITSQQKGDFATLCKMLPSTCINWTSESAPKVAATTIIKNMLHGKFSLLFLLAFRIYSWQMTSKLCPRFLITLLNLEFLCGDAREKCGSTVGFIREVEYSDWLANVVVIPKKSGKW